MKTIKHVPTAEVKRVDDMTAHKTVDNVTWIYVPKSEYKKLRTT